MAEHELTLATCPLGLPKFADLPVKGITLLALAGRCLPTQVLSSLVF